MTSLRPIAVGLCLCLVTLAVPSAYAQARTSSSALISEQLDQLIKLDLNKTPLPQVLKTIEAQTDVPIRVTDDVYDILPWGKQTPITASLENLKLREALDAIGSKLGLQFDLREEYVECSPQAPLRRLGRRATLEELRTLDLVKTRVMSRSAASLTLAELAKAIDDSLLELERSKASGPPVKIMLEVRTSPGVDLTKTTVVLPRGATIANALDVFDSQSPLTWYPWGDSIVVLPKQDVIQQQLDRVVTLRYDGVDINQVLLDLSKKTNVPFQIEPGAIQRVTPEFRIIKLSADATIRQSLESLQGYTGLGYVVTDTGVYIWNQNSSPAAARRGRVIATVQVGNAQVLVYEDQLSPEARQALIDQQSKAVSDLEAALTGKPATQPADHHN
jgi:hypothetical protein